MTTIFTTNRVKNSPFFKKWHENSYNTPLNEEAQRYTRLAKDLKDVIFFSSPGRAELVGNHTDHNNGLVLATTINLDTVAAVQKTDSKNVIIRSEGYPEVVVDIENLSVRNDEYGKSSAIVRGILKGFCDKGYEIGGFIANTHSKIFKGAGVSSSAAFELLICEILNVLYNQNKIDFVTKALISQFAENHYFGKPSGLMDQLAIASGGVNYMDFENAIPKVEKLDWEFEKLSLVIINCGGDHSDLTHEYAQIKDDMKNIAKSLGKENLRQTSQQDFYNNIKDLKKAYGGRAILRAKHFYEENERVKRALLAINNKDEQMFAKAINLSGVSSYEQLQNCFIKGDKEQNIPYALKLAERYPDIKAFRVHGGGFAGTILAIIDKDKANDFSDYMKEYFGNDNVFALCVRKTGATKVEV